MSLGLIFSEGPCTHGIYFCLKVLFHMGTVGPKYVIHWYLDPLDNDLDRSTCAGTVFCAQSRLEILMQSGVCPEIPEARN